MTLLHIPTGVEVAGKMQKGNYSRSEMQQMKDKVLKELYIELEKKVAAFLRIPGRA